MRKIFTRFKLLVGNFVVLVCFTVPFTLSAQIPMGKVSTSYTQSFDDLPVSGSATWENGKEYLPGWSVHRTVTSVNSITANHGSLHTGGLYSYGSISATDRALGSIASSPSAGGEFTYNLLFQNTSGDAIKYLDISYTGEQWRAGNINTGIHSITFSYAIAISPTGFNLSPRSNVGWKEVPDLEFKSKVYFTSGMALNGNAPANKSYQLAMLNVEIPDGYYIMLRWRDADEPEMDHGLAIDDVKVWWSNDKLTPLPVELVRFSAKPSGKAVTLNWVTASETNNDHFAVLRSADGFKFEQIATVQGYGNTKALVHYSFIDIKPLSGTSYYKLKQVDEDGQFEYSSLIAVEGGENYASINVYPTICDHELKIELPHDLRKYTLQVVDQTGRRLIQQKLPPLLGAYILNVSSLNPGSYVLIIINEQEERIIKRFVKK